MKNILFLKPHLVYEMWGSNKLKNYNIDIGDAPDVGEAWVISAVKDKSSVILNGEYKGQTLYDVFIKHKELFDNFNGDTYPIVAKILDVNQNLSVNVPQSDGEDKANKTGKKKFWYILETKPNSSIVYGHNAKTKDELNELIHNDKWEELLKSKQVKAGDYVYVPGGCVHAFNEGIILYSLEQVAGQEFKMYNYNRDLFFDNYKLDVEDSIKHVKIPFDEPTIPTKNDILIEGDKSKVVKIANTKKTTYDFPDARWIQATVIDGKGKLDDNYEISKGISFIITSPLQSFTLDGNITILISYLKKQ